MCKRSILEAVSEKESLHEELGRCTSLNASLKHLLRLDVERVSTGVQCMLMRHEFVADCTAVVENMVVEEAPAVEEVVSGNEVRLVCCSGLQCVAVCCSVV